MFCSSGLDDMLIVYRAASRQFSLNFSLLFVCSSVILPFFSQRIFHVSQVHAMSVMKAITMVVDSLDNSATLMKELKNLGASHGRHKIEVSHFRVTIFFIFPSYNLQ